MKEELRNMKSKHKKLEKDFQHLDTLLKQKPKTAAEKKQLIDKNRLQKQERKSGLQTENGWQPIEQGWMMKQWRRSGLQTEQEWQLMRQGLQPEKEWQLMRQGLQTEQEKPTKEIRGVYSLVMACGLRR